MAFTPREEQQQVLSYTGGTMGISAVPGSGKTFTLSALAAELVEKLVRDSTQQEPDQEILIVTFSNAAALNFSARIAAFLAERGLLPGIGYKVCTLHSMALDMSAGIPSNWGSRKTSLSWMRSVRTFCSVGQLICGTLWMNGKPLTV